MKRVVISHAAKNDLDAIWDYTEQEWGRGQAETYTQNIWDACVSIADGTRIARPVDVREGYFKCALAKHIIFFTREADSITVRRILHQSMDTNAQL